MCEISEIKQLQNKYSSFIPLYIPWDGFVLTTNLQSIVTQRRAKM